jgi:hypothetical protein
MSTQSTSTETATYSCASDRWEPTGDSYTVEAFLAMCQDCHGEAPDLLETSRGILSDRETGEAVLYRDDLVACERCSGSGREPWHSPTAGARCHACRGAGMVPPA